MHRRKLATAPGPLQQQIGTQCKLAKILVPFNYSLPAGKARTGLDTSALREQAQTLWKQQGPGASLQAQPCPESFVFQGSSAADDQKCLLTS